MTVNEGLRGVAGLFTIVSVALGYWVHPGFFLFTAFVGANLLQSAFTGSCPMMAMLRWAGLRADGDVAIGDEVILFGAGQGTRLPVEEAAAAAETISYELLVRVGARVPRRIEA